MVTCLIDVNSKVEFIQDGIMNCIRWYDQCPHQDVAPESRDKEV